MARHRKGKPSKKDLRGTTVLIGDEVKRRRRRGEVVGWDMRDPKRVVYYVVVKAKRKKR